MQGGEGGGGEDGEEEEGEDEAEDEEEGEEEEARAEASRKEKLNFATSVKAERIKPEIASSTPKIKLKFGTQIRTIKHIK